MTSFYRFLSLWALVTLCAAQPTSAANPEKLASEELRPAGLPPAASQTMQGRNDAAVSGKNEVRTLAAQNASDAVKVSYGASGHVSSMQWSDGTTLTFTYLGGPGAPAGTPPSGGDKPDAVEIAGAGGVLIVRPPAIEPGINDPGVHTRDDSKPDLEKKLGSASGPVEVRMNRDAFDAFVSTLERKREGGFDFKRLASLLSGYKDDQQKAVSSYVQKTKTYYDSIESSIKSKLGVDLSAPDEDELGRILALEAAVAQIREGTLAALESAPQEAVSEILALEEKLRAAIIEPGQRELNALLQKNGAIFQRDVSAFLQGAVTSVQETNGAVEIVIVLP